MARVFRTIGIGGGVGVEDVLVQSVARVALLLVMASISGRS